MTCEQPPLVVAMIKGPTQVKPYDTSTPVFTLLKVVSKEGQIVCVHVYVPSTLFQLHSYVETVG